jgi:HupE / UreJ protein
VDLRRILIPPLALAVLAALALSPVVTPRPASAHEFALESVATAFVKIEPHEAHLVVRVPLHALKAVSFPMRGREIDPAAAGSAIQQALAGLGRDITIWENDRPLVASGALGRLSLPSDRSFERYETAAAHVARPVVPGSVVYFEQGYVDAHLTYPITSPRARFAVRTALAPELKDYLKLTIRYLPLGDDARAMVITSRSGQVSLDPTWYQAVAGFAVLGVAHILNGIDHLLFLLCVVIPLRGVRQILPIVTAFTVAHSVTLLGSAYDLAPVGAWFPPFVETVIAASTVYMALENIVGAGLRRRWLVTGLFGLVHGFGFAYGLKENLQFAGRHLLVSLVSFNVGIEIGQLLVLAAVLPALAALLRYVLVGRIGIIILSAVVAHAGWHWMTERWDVLSRVPWPSLDAAGLASLARWVAAVLVAAGAAGLLLKRLRGVRVPRRA